MGKFAQDVGKGALLLGGFAFAAKQAFNLASEGAQIKQTYISFNRLMDVVGASPTLLDELKMAARGTVDEISLMSSTTMLLAGTSGELSKKMAEAAPELLRIADAANMLNPTLGDTTFFFNSLATGIKRGSPLLIDNLGITLSAEDAYRALAAELGKTTDELTKDEKAQALLNEVLRKGKTVMEQAGNGASSLTDNYESLNVAVKEATNLLKSNLDEALRPVGVEVAKFLQDGTAYEKTQKKINEAYRAGNLTFQEHRDLLVQLRWRHITDAEAMDILAKKTDKYALSTHEASKAAYLNKRASWEQAQAVEEVGERTVTASDQMNQYAMKAYEAAHATEEVTDKTERLNQKMDDLRTFIGGQLGPEVDGFNDKQDDLKGKMGEVQQKIDELNAKKYLTPEQKEELETLKGDYRELKSQYLENAREHDLATKKIMFNLLEQRAAIDGLTAAELESLTSIAKKWGLVDQATADYVIAADQYFKDLAAGLVEPKDMLEYINRLLDDTERERFGKVTIFTNMTAQPNIQGGQITQAVTPSSGVRRAPVVQGGQITQERATGGPVMPYGDYLVGEAGPERLTMRGGRGWVTPNSQISQDQRPININIYGNVTRDNAYTLARQVGNELQRQARYN